MSAQHTPGPWEWDGDVCDYDPRQDAPWLVHESAEHGFVRILGGEIKCGNTANARLLAAAPDMFDVLGGMLDWLEGNPGNRDGLIERARAAINKATGRTQ